MDVALASLSDVDASAVELVDLLSSLFSCEFDSAVEVLWAESELDVEVEEVVVVVLVDVLSFDSVDEEVVDVEVSVSVLVEVLL